MLKMNRHLVSVTVVVLLFSLFVGCGDDSGTGAKPTPPEIPPVSSFVMDFSEFTTSQEYQPSGSDRVGDHMSMHNWSWAATNVLVWNTLITVGLAVPVAAFIESFNHEPTRQPDGTWVWDYNFTVNQVVHLAELHGRVVEEEVQWEMYISKEGEYTDFLWYWGASDLGATEGTWTLFDNPTDPTPLVGIGWHRDPGSGTGDIKYSNVVPEGQENGGYIFYGTTDGDPYDAFYDIYNKGLDNHTEIEWNRTSKAGRVMDANHFGDSDWRCWDSDHQDVSCQP
jgi:hypothetical protein